LSSRTRKVPAASRTTSMPEMWTRTPPAGSKPCTWRWKWALVVTSWRGMTPSATTFILSYTSLRKASRARTRCATPFSSTVHSSAGI